jgi:hypothetical protein
LVKGLEKFIHQVFEFSGGIEKKEKCGQVNCDEDVDII